MTYKFSVYEMLDDGTYYWHHNTENIEQAEFLAISTGTKLNKKMIIFEAKKIIVPHVKIEIKSL